MKKLPKSGSLLGLTRTGMKVLLMVEGIGLIASYAVWRSLNTSQDFRCKVHQHCPAVLESYYWMGETLGNLQTRQQDYQAWGVAGKKWLSHSHVQEASDRYSAGHATKVWSRPLPLDERPDCQKYHWQFLVVALHPENSRYFIDLTCAQMGKKMGGDLSFYIWAYVNNFDHGLSLLFLFCLSFFFSVFFLSLMFIPVFI